MSDMYLFRVYIADAERTEEGMTVRLWYPTTPEVTSKRVPKNPRWGVQVFERLLREGYTPLADQNNPVRPSAAGSAYLFDDGVILFHRRDAGAPTHALYHSIPGGFPRTREEVYTESGLVSCGLRETAEENILLTNERSPRLLVPKGSEQHTLESAKRLGLDTLPRVMVETERVDPPDILKVYDENWNCMFSTRAFLEFLFDSEASINALQVVRIRGFTSKDVLPLDGEYMDTRDGKRIFFNRECYLVKLEDLEGKRFGDPLDSPTVYKADLVAGDVGGPIRVPRLQTPADYKPPYLGPDKAVVSAPHIFGPDDMLVRILDGLGIQGFSGRWMELQLEKERAEAAKLGDV